MHERSSFPSTLRSISERINLKTESSESTGCNKYEGIQLKCNRDNIALVIEGEPRSLVTFGDERELPMYRAMPNSQQSTTSQTVTRQQTPN